MTNDKSSKKINENNDKDNKIDSIIVNIRDDKRDYLIKTLSRTKRKDYENYVIGALWHRLDNLEIKPASQQYVKRSDGKYALLDLYFPQLNIGIECDEKYHEKNTEADKIKEIDVERALTALTNPYTLIRINVNNNMESIDNQISNAVEQIKSIYIKRGCPKWSDELPPHEQVKNNGIIHNNEQLYFRTITEISKCFGKSYKNMQQCTFFLDENTMVWCPKLAIVNENVTKPASNAGWVNTLSDDWSQITEICPEQLEMKQKMLSRDLKRVVFAKSKNPIGQSVYRFIGVYMLDEFDQKVCVHKQISCEYKI